MTTARTYVRLTCPALGTCRHLPCVVSEAMCGKSVIALWKGGSCRVAHDVPLVVSYHGHKSGAEREAHQLAHRLRECGYTAISVKRGL